MATAGKAAFRPEQHEQLLALRALGWGDVKLAAEFGVSVPTVRKWSSLPLGHQVGKGGRKRIAPAASTPGLAAQEDPEGDAKDGTAA